MALEAPARPTPSPAPNAMGTDIESAALCILRHARESGLCEAQGAAERMDHPFAAVHGGPPACELAAAPTTRKLRVGFMTTHWCRSHSLYMHAGALVERLPRNLVSFIFGMRTRHAPQETASSRRTRLSTGTCTFQVTCRDSTSRVTRSQDCD